MPSNPLIPPHSLPIAGGQSTAGQGASAGHTPGTIPPTINKPTIPPVAKIVMPKIRTEKDKILDEMGVILAEAGGIESNIGMTSDYWVLQRKYRAL